MLPAFGSCLWILWSEPNAPPGAACSWWDSNSRHLCTGRCQQMMSWSRFPTETAVSLAISVCSLYRVHLRPRPGNAPESRRTPGKNTVWSISDARRRPPLLGLCWSAHCWPTRRPLQCKVKNLYGLFFWKGITASGGTLLDFVRGLTSAGRLWTCRMLLSHSNIFRWTEFAGLAFREKKVPRRPIRF